jgi:hypothetical protein
MFLHRLPVPIVLATLILNPLQASQSTIGGGSGLALAERALSALLTSITVQDVTLTGTAQRIAGSDDETGTVVVKAASTGSARIALSLPSGTRSEIRAASPSGFVGSWSGPDGARHAIAYHNLMTDSGLFPAFTLANFISSQNAVVAYVGQEVRNGASALHLSAYQKSPGPASEAGTLPQHLSQTEIYLDPASLVPVAIAFNTHPEDNALVDIPVSIEFSDYRRVNGAQIPFHIQKFINYSLALELEFQTATINSGLSTSDFSAGL